MKTLIKFLVDDVYFVSTKCLKKRGKYFVKWHDGHYYEAIPIISNNDENMLNQLAYNLNNNFPRVSLSNNSEPIFSSG